MMLSATASTCSTPVLPDDSAGSSVSTRLMDEYDELLKYAVVVPTFDPQEIPQSLTDLKGSFPFNKSEMQVQNSGQVIEDLIDIEDNNTTLLENDKDDSQLNEQVDDLEQRIYNHEQLTTGTDGVRFANEINPVMTITDNTDTAIYTQRTSNAKSGKFANTIFREALAEVVDDCDSVAGSDTATMLSSVVSYTSNIDEDLNRMDGLMDTWLTGLKRNVMSEFSQSKIKQLEHAQRQLYKESQRHSSEKQQLYMEIETMKELLNTYEMSIERKDNIIANLTRGMQRGRDRQEMLKSFSEWKIKHNDTKRESFASNLAHRHYQRTLCQKVWTGWHSVLEARWKSRVEKACQAKAAELCMQLTNDYEAKLASATEALESARSEVSRLHEEREHYEETMKKAFMRGVCALNMEAMGMFQQQSESEAVHLVGEAKFDNGTIGATHPGSTPAPTFQDIGECSRLQDGRALLIDKEIGLSEAPGAPTSKYIHNVRDTQSSNTAKSSLVNKAIGTKHKVINAKVTARGTMKQLGGGLAPPMSSVVVQRHQPITKQTIAHATAMKYPRSAAQNKLQSTNGTSQRKIAGQMPVVTPNISTVRVVD